MIYYESLEYGEIVLCQSCHEEYQYCLCHEPLPVVCDELIKDNDEKDAFQICAEAEELQSAIGHESTAQILSRLLCQKIEMNRINFQQSQDDVAICFRLN